MGRSRFLETGEKEADEVKPFGDLEARRKEAFVTSALDSCFMKITLVVG